MPLPRGDQQELLNRIDETFYFALSRKADEGSEPVKTDDGELWITSIDVVDGVAQSKAYFVNIQDATYDVWEVDAQGNRMNKGTAFGSTILSRIATAHGDDDSNNASISDTVWTDAGAVKNTFEPNPIKVVVGALTTPTILTTQAALILRQTIRNRPPLPPKQPPRLLPRGMEAVGWWRWCLLSRLAALPSWPLRAIGFAVAAGDVSPRFSS